MSGYSINGSMEDYHMSVKMSQLEKEVSKLSATNLENKKRIEKTYTKLVHFRDVYMPQVKEEMYQHLENVGKEIEQELKYMFE